MIVRTLLVILGVLAGLIGAGCFALAVSAYKGEQTNVNGMIGPLAVTVLAADALLYRHRRTHADKRTLGMVLTSSGFASAALAYPAWRIFNPRHATVVVSMFPFGHAHAPSPSPGAIFSLGAEGIAALLLSLAIWSYATLKPAGAEADVFD